MSNSLDLDQEQHSVGPDHQDQQNVALDRDPNCLQRLSADDKSLLLQGKS